MSQTQPVQFLQHQIISRYNPKVSFPLCSKFLSKERDMQNLLRWHMLHGPAIPPAHLRIIPQYLPTYPSAYYAYLLLTMGTHVIAWHTALFHHCLKASLSSSAPSLRVPRSESPMMGAAVGGCRLDKTERCGGVDWRAGKHGAWFLGRDFRV